MTPLFGVSLPANIFVLINFSDHMIAILTLLSALTA
jgi:hypothetical protein